MERTKETLEARVRETPLVDRLKECQQRIGNMCAELRGPKMSIPVEYYDDDFYICTTLADAQATVDALQARVQELEARQHFGACAKCLTNAWRICKEGTPDAVEMKCSNGSTWWLCDYCLSKEQLTQRTAEVTQLQALVRALLDTWVNGRKIHDGIPMTLRQQIDATLDATTPATMGSNILEEDIGKAMIRSKGGDGE